MTTINLLFELDLGLAARLLEGGGRLEDGELVEEDGSCLLDWVFTEDADNVFV